MDGKGIINILNGNKASVGTGFYVSPNGYILTCYHVLEEINSIAIGSQVAFRFVASERIHLSSLRAIDISKDIAILQTDVVSATYYAFQVRGRSGDQLATLGFPNGDRIGIPASPVLQDYIENEKYIQLKDANTITYGFSGAPLVTEAGFAVGMVAWIPKDHNSRMQNIAHAIPSQLIIEAFSNYVEVSDEAGIIHCEAKFKKFLCTVTVRKCVFALVVLCAIVLFTAPFLSNIKTSSKPAPSDANSDDITSIDTTFYDVYPDDSISNDIASNEIISDNSIYDAILNGTMPKGTKPIAIPVSEEMKKIFESIQDLSIGTSKEWVDDKLGVPYIENVVEVTEEGRLPYDIDGSRIGEDSIVDEFLECVYRFDIVLVRIYFDTSEYHSCRAFFVTLMEDALGVDVVMPEVYSSLVSNKSLGEFAFTEILWEPTSVYGYVSQGNGRAFYGEQHYFMGSGNYQDFYFAILDYGMLNSYKEFGRFLSLVQLDINPLNNSANSYDLSNLLAQERSKLYPNTYGISTLSSKITFSLLGTYVGFDSIPLRG